MHFMCFALVCPWVGAIMVHEKQHSHLRAPGGYPHPHRDPVPMWSHIQGGAGVMLWVALIGALVSGFMVGMIIPLPKKEDNA